MAVGASARDVYRMILRQAAGLGVAGAALGVFLAGLLSPLAAGMVQDARTSLAFAAATAAALIGIALLAAWAPARRAARIEPTVALKGR
jgi:putative ABC transport system permease protein